MALSHLLPWKPDMILSGINNGSNIARNVLYSGTLGAVIEGALRGFAGIAFSCERHNAHTPNYPLAAQYIPRIVKYVLENPMPAGTILNVNVPDDIEEIKGIRMTRQGREYWIENLSVREHPVDNKPYFWLGASIESFEESMENDSQVIRQGYITATPVHVDDLTDEEVFSRRKEAFETAINDPELAQTGV
jgi:5'-nucleotidase